MSKSTHGQGAVRLPAEMANEDKKRAAAEAALELVRDGMTLGLGTGSTARWFVAGVGERVASGRLRDLACVPTSKATAEQATAAGLRLVELPTAGVDLAVDGMDELAPSLDAIKGLGGALLREKIVAAAAATFVLVGDDTKLVSRLGEKALVPVEVVPFGMRRTVEVLAGLCDQVEPRTEGSDLFVTDNGNHVVDCRPRPGFDAEELQAELKSVAGVVEHGLFLGMADIAFVAGENGVGRYGRGERA